MTRAEVVDRQSYSQLADLVEDASRPLGVAHDARLGDLKPKGVG